MCSTLQPEWTTYRHLQQPIVETDHQLDELIKKIIAKEDKNNTWPAQSPIKKCDYQYRYDYSIIYCIALNLLKSKKASEGSI